MCSLDKALNEPDSFEWMIRYFQILCPHTSVIKALYLMVHQYLVQGNLREKVLKQFKVMIIIFW